MYVGDLGELSFSSKLSVELVFLVNLLAGYEGTLNYYGS